MNCRLTWWSSAPYVTLAEVTYMEEQIDAWTEELPEMKEFILPGGSKTSANLQYARALARTSERVCVLYADESGEVKSDSLKYLNRLSDYLFVMAATPTFWRAWLMSRASPPAAAASEKIS